MLTGGADSSIKLWDLDDIKPHKNIQTLTPKDSVKKFVPSPISPDHNHADSP